MSEREDLPVVDEQRLARALQIGSWPKGGFSTRHQRMAARVITDANQPSMKTGKVTPESAMINATAWIERAYVEGRHDGAREANKQFKSRIMAMFGIEDAATGRKE